MDIHLHNTKTRQKELLRPVVPGQVSMYVCGPTVYDRAHIGNARPVIVFDVLFRLLRHVYGADAVTYVRNFTDVDDKINARAAASGRSIGEITEETIKWYHEDMEALGTLRPTKEPRATDWIGAMVEMIEGLIASGHAYAAEGHVLFRVRSYEAYGALSGRSVDDMISGARVEVAPYKEDPLDFVLWKPSSDDLPGWESPWGRGRPGWHIECSAMAHGILGDSFDIHGGGNDLMFPHHENEIAQSCCAHPEGDFAHIWMHNEMLQVEGKKMSKSLGNFFTVRDLLDEGVPGEVIRFVFMGTHYRKPMDWTEKKRREAHVALSVIYDKFESALNNFHSDVVRSRMPEWRLENLPIPSSPISSALGDDLNTVEALRHFREHARNADETDPNVQRQVLANGLLLGFFARPTFFPSTIANRYFDLSVIERQLIELRSAATLTKDYSEVDRLKSALTEAGVEVQVSKEGVKLLQGPDFDPAKLEALK